ncbi:MAG: hypothetical protein BGO88_11755 [Flavobacterium sp. 38-13]|jgi:hypothetical protein|uniref:hypothetical protein n=1 Tax=Flavobacterium sp. 38-13 TaxID=1896168 RepID=UPI00095B26A1|nr:hypothetical protein [Flavobacterium sp. 38-13]OJX54317.1 MAG: hypothetical protein BGO88_11755 [Flavobacterium sp. 38-13]
MKPIKKISALLLMILGTSIISCSDDGKDGVDGLNGMDGEPGTANVIYSDWLDRPVGTEATIDGTSGMLYTYSVPQITNEILNSGTVLVYMQFNGADIFALPYTSRAGNSINTIEAITTLGNLKIFRYRHDGLTPTIAVGSGVKFRYIIIPGGTPAARSINLRDRSYDEVCELLAIPK